MEIHPGSAADFLPVDNARSPDRSSSKNARCRTSTAHLCERRAPRRKLAKLPRSLGPKESGRWMQRFRGGSAIVLGPARAVRKTVDRGGARRRTGRGRSLDRRLPGAAGRWRGGPGVSGCGRLAQVGW